jgi:hypothetical protein
VNSAIAAASFSRLSPSRITSSRRGAPISRKVETTAAGSVVEIAAPSSRQAISPNGDTLHTARPTQTVARMTASTAITSTTTASSSSRRTLTASAISNSSGGRNRISSARLSSARASSTHIS